MTRISSALNSDDLSQQERPCDVDTVRALGLTAIHRGMGVLMMEALESCAGDSSHDRARVRQLIAAVHERVRKQAQRDKIAIRLWPVAEFLVRELLIDRCPRCSGRGFLPLAYGPDAGTELRGEECPSCSGSGRAKRDLNGRARAAGHDEYSPALKAFYEAMESRLVEAEEIARWHYRWRFAD